MIGQETTPAIQRDPFTIRAGDGVALVGERWLAAGRPKASLVLSHGYAEQIGRYEHVLKPLTVNRFAIYAADHRGHGKSDGERALIDRFDRYVDDLDLVVNRARQEQGGKPCYLVGHSMGGLIALRYALAHPDKIDALVLSGGSAFGLDAAGTDQRQVWSHHAAELRQSDRRHAEERTPRKAAGLLG